MTRSHESQRELLAIHALDALEPREAAELEAHLRECQGCCDELDGHRAVASHLAAQSIAADVPPSLWRRVRSEIEHPAPVARIPRRLPFVVAVGAAAAMLALVVIQTSRLSSAESELLATASRLREVEQAISTGNWIAAGEIAASLPGARSVALTGDARTEITLLPDGTGFITASDLADLPEAQTYQLWIIQRGEVISAGLLRDGAIGSAFRFDPATLEGLVVTAEEAAGVVISDGPAVAAWFAA